MLFVVEQFDDWRFDISITHVADGETEKADEDIDEVQECKYAGEHGSNNGKSSWHYLLGDTLSLLSHLNRKHQPHHNKSCPVEKSIETD